MNWQYNNPNFECDNINYDLLRYAPWSGHRNFVYDLVSCFKPQTIAELGSHYGCSAFTFCQADKDNNIGSSMYFVDTWEGDDYTKKYNNDVYTIFKKTVDTYYSSQNVEMVRTTFDNAVNQFDDKYFDIIHIDGSHHYDDVKDDFEKWLPKLKSNGIMLLHDVSSDIVLGDVMGSYKFWQEIKNKYQYTIEFDFSWGLGVIFFDKEKYDFVINNVDLNKYQRNNNALDVEFKDKLRQNYFSLKDKQMYIDDLNKQKEVLLSHLDSYKKDTQAKDKYANELLADKEALDKLLAQKDDFIFQQSAHFETEKAQIHSDYSSTISGKDKYISSLENTVNCQQSDISTLYNKITELEGKLANMTEQKVAVELLYKDTIEYKLRQLKRKIIK